VKLSSDLKTANVFVSVLGEETKQRTTMRALEHAAGFIQKRLFQEVKLRYTPSITFHIDHSVERSIRISRILREEGVPDTGGFGETEEQTNHGDAKDSERILP
jgi:ribosome-binding factor A